MTLFNRITFIISLLCLFFILYSVDWGMMNELSHLIKTEAIILAMLVFCIFQITKVLRYTALIESKLLPKFSVLYYVMNKHAFYLAVLPVRMGDIYYSSLLKNHTNIAHRIGNISLYIARMYDILLLSLLTVIGLATVTTSLNPIVNFVLISLCLITFILVSNLIRTLKIMNYLLLKFPVISKYPFTTTLSDNIKISIQEIEKQHRLKTHIKIIIMTILNWFGTIIIFWIILNMFELNLNLIQVAFIVAVINMFSLIPIQTIGGFGIRETGLLTALSLLGYSINESSTYAIIARLVVYLTSLAAILMLMMIFNYFTNIPNFTNKTNN